MKAVQTYGRVNVPVRLHNDVIIGEYQGKENDHIKVITVNPPLESEEPRTIEAILKKEYVDKINRSKYRVYITDDKIGFVDNEDNVLEFPYISISVINDIKGDIEDLADRVDILERLSDHRPIPNPTIIEICVIGV